MKCLFFSSVNMVELFLTESFRRQEDAFMVYLRMYFVYILSRKKIASSKVNMPADCM